MILTRRLLPIVLCCSGFAVLLVGCESPSGAATKPTSSAAASGEALARVSTTSTRRVCRASPR